MCSVVDGDGDQVLMTTSYEEWSAVAQDEDQIRTMATADLMEFYANEIVEDLAHRPYVELGIHSDSDSELANVYSGLETIMEETSDDMRSDTESMRSDTESMRSGPTSWAWSQDSADVETVIDAGRGRDSRFEDDFNPLEHMDAAALESTGKLSSGVSLRSTNSDKYRQLFDFEAFLNGDEMRRAPSVASQPPSMDPIFATSATQYPFSDSVQAAPLSRPTEPPPPPPPCAADHGFRLGPLQGSCHSNPFASLPERSVEGPPELVFSLEDVLDHRTRPGQEPGNGGRAPPPAGHLTTESAAGGAKVLGTSCNGASGVSGAAPGGSGCGSRLSSARSVTGTGGGIRNDQPGQPPTAPGSSGPKWDLGSCEDFENLNRRIESLTFDFEEEERRSLEYIVDGDGGSSEGSDSPADSGLGGGSQAPRLRDCRIRRFHSFGDLSMITEDELHEGGSEHSLTTTDAERWAPPAERPRRRRAGHPGLLRHSSENLSEDSGYGDHTGDRVSPPNPSGRSTGLLQRSPPPSTGSAAAGGGSHRSPLGRLSKSTSDLSPGSQRRRRLLELISRDEQRRARLYGDAPRSDARLSPPRLADAPPPVDGDEGETPPSTGDGDGGDAALEDDGGARDSPTEVESVLVLLENEESNSVIQVLREKVARARALDGMASAPVPAPRSTVARAPAVYQNVPTNARGRRATAPARHSSETAPLDRRVKRDIEQFERIKEAFLEKGTYNVHADMAQRSQPAPAADGRSAADLSSDRPADGGRTDDPLPTDAARSSTDTGGATGRAGVNKGAAEMGHDPGGNQGHQPSATRAEPTDQPRDIYLPESEAQFMPMYRSAVGRPKPLDLKLAEEFLLLEGIEGEEYPADGLPCGRESPRGRRRSQERLCVPPPREEVAAADGQPISGGAGEGERAGPDWTAGPGRSRSLWNLAAAVDGQPAPESAAVTCDWQRSRNRTGAWLLSKSVQDLWSENNMDSPRRLDYYNQTMEWPGSGDYLACSAERLRSPVSPASSSGRLSEPHCAPTRPAPPPPPAATLNLDGVAATCAELKFARPSDVCSSWLVASMEPETSEQRSLNGQAFFVEPSSAAGGSTGHLNGTLSAADGADSRTMSVNNSFTARVPVKAYGAGSDVEVYINREQTAAQPPAERSRESADGEGVTVRTKPRGVQFSPMVSEVQWRESYLEDEPDRRSMNTFQQQQPHQQHHQQHHQQQHQQHQQQQQQQEDGNQQTPTTHTAQPSAVETGNQTARPRAARSPPPAPPPRQTHPTAPEPPQRTSGSTDRLSGTEHGGAAVLRPVRPPTVPVVAPRSSASLPGRGTDSGVHSDTAAKSATTEPIRGRANGGQASPLTVRTQENKAEKGEKPEKPPKSSVLQRLGLGRLSGRSKPKPPPKPENIKPTSRSPPASPPPPVPPPQPLQTPVSTNETESRRPVTSTPVVGQRTASPVPAPVASPVVGHAQGTPVSVPTAAPGQEKANLSPIPSSESSQSPVEQSVPKAEFHAPPSPAVRAKTLSLPRTADIKLESTPVVSGSGGPVSSTSQTGTPSSAGAPISDPSSAGRPAAKPPLPPQALRTQTQAARARLTSARRNFFQLDQQRVIPLRSVPAPPIPDSAQPPATRPSAASDIKDAFERFRRRAQEDRARLAKSTPDLSLIESATRSIVRPIPAAAATPSSAAGLSIDRRRATAEPAATSPHSVTLQEKGNVVILHADGGAAAARPPSKNRDRFAQRRAAALARARSRSVGVLETDIDAPHQETDLDAIVLSLQQCIDEASPPKEKAKSLLHLDRGGMEFSLPRGADSRAKSMEFLLDDENKTAVQPPENDLMRGERQLSEHELRFQRSLRNLNTPEWYKKSSAKPETTLRRDYGSGSLAGGWSGFNSKSTSKESLQSSRCTTPTTQSKVVIPSRVRPPDWRYVRGTSRESLTSPGSGAASPAASDRGPGLYFGGVGRASQPSSGTQSPVGSGTGSLGGHGRRPVYMGWRSQERLGQGYQTPVDRLASSFSRGRSEGNLTSGGGRLSLPRSSGASSAAGSTGSVNALRPPPDLDVHSSIREVTSAIVHYFDSTGSASGSASELGGRAGSPRRRRSPARGSRSTSPSRRPVWLETAFVGTKPMDEPPTPEAAGAVLSDPLAAGGGGSGGGGGGSAASSPATASDSAQPRPEPQGDRYELGELLMV
ncbi:uncharacterized protein LOC122385642 [Amphibalanus amphitrite]|uniref:uncharacterized protein LOC122385642 n=1 Tax=Amphibalanus amphitrite TaxID=1232801 RepID=UPI001C91DDED|nr:uncharacterized protein LOC122385642 [Amphibalanus amphitrite]